jgi:hypothetical protein
MMLQHADSRLRQQLFGLTAQFERELVVLRGVRIGAFGRLLNGSCGNHNVS